MTTRRSGGSSRSAVPPVTDDAMLAVALHICAQEPSLREIAQRLVKASTRQQPPSCGCSATTMSGH
ncbi:hypothetical protein ACFVHS_44015 [Streptomyces sp. NPDC057746]|uniref:hypothetical protein n=1 Tax=Streptomyces sp. NPDC057746 TaxID=3346237 RepID=UPI00367CB18A